MNPNSPQSRRTFLKRGSATVAGTALAGGLPALALGAQSALASEAQAANVIVGENTQTPQSSWSSNFQITNMSSTTQGYARRTSVNLGENVDLVVSGPGNWLSTDPNEILESVQVELYRLGYYGGKGGRLVWTSPVVSTWQKFDAAGQPSNSGSWPVDAPNDASTGLIGLANFHTTLTIPSSAITTSGVYLAKLKGAWYEYPGGATPVAKTGDSHAVIVVRDDNRARDLLVLLPSNTWQAYNYWGGRSLYTYNSRYGNAGKMVTATGTERAAKVSLDRPYNNWIGDLNWVLHTEFPAIYWLEQQGFDLSYTEDVALSFDQQQAQPSHSKGVAILGHGEYWTKEIRDALESGRDAGTSIYNFGANTGYWRVRYETVAGKPATNAAEARVMVCYKTVEGGGTDQPKVASLADPVAPTTSWRDPGKGSGVATPGTTAATPTSYSGNNRPERGLLGVQYIGDDDNGSRPLTVPADNGSGEFAGHTAWRNAGLSPKASNTLGSALLGWEWDGIPTASQPFGGAAPLTKAGSGGVKRMSQTDPRIGMPSGTQTAYIADAGRTYGARGTAAQPPSGWDPYSHAVTYIAPSGAFVFSAGTIQWSWGLGPHYLDDTTGTYASPRTDTTLKAITQATANLLVDGGIVPATPAGVTITGAPVTSTTPVVVPATTPVATTPKATTPVATTPKATTPTATTPKATTPVATTPVVVKDKDAPTLTLAITNSTSTFFGSKFYVIPKTTLALGVKVSCDAKEVSGPVTLTLQLQDATGVMATATGSVQPGGSTVVNLVLTAAAYKRVTTLLGRSATLTTVGTDAVGNAAKRSDTVKLRNT